MRNQDLTPEQRESVQLQQSLARLTPKGFTIYHHACDITREECLAHEHDGAGWYFKSRDYSPSDPYETQEEALEACIAFDNYDGPPEGDAWSGGFAENH